MAYKDKLIPSVVENQLKYTDGHIYAFPRTGPAVDLLFFNKKVFEQNGVKIPTNYPELLAAVKAFNAKGIVPVQHSPNKHGRSVHSSTFLQ